MDWTTVIEKGPVLLLIAAGAWVSIGFYIIEPWREYRSRRPRN